MADSMFARWQLEKHGWTEGVGLGKHETGITKPIKVVRKNNKDGVGHIPGSDLTKNWWDQAYNKTASQILVKTTEDGTTVHKKETIEIKKNKTLLYARFVKGATLKSSEGRTIEEAEENSSESDNEKEQIPPRLTDEEILKICGGRTAHKAAKHGLKQNGKLQRIEEQERQYLESLNKKSKSVENLSTSKTKRRNKDEKVVEESVVSEAEQEEKSETSRDDDELHGEIRQKKAKDKIRFLEEERGEGSELSVMTKKMKKKKCKKESKQNQKGEDTDEIVENGKVKSSKKKKDLLQENETTSVDIENLVYSEKKRMKKKRKKQYLEEEELEKESQEICVNEERKEEVCSVRKKRKKNKLEKEDQFAKKKKKCQTEDEPEMQRTEMEEENSRNDPILYESEKEVKENKKRKKKDKKKRDEETEEKSFIGDEQFDVEKSQPDKLRNQIEKRIRDEDMINICHKKKVVFSPKLCTVYTFRKDENEMTTTSKKKKKTKKI